MLLEGKKTAYKKKETINDRQTTTSKRNAKQKPIRPRKTLKQIRLAPISYDLSREPYRRTDPWIQRCSQSESGDPVLDVNSFMTRKVQTGSKS